MTSTISSKGQVTVPKDVRDRLGLRTGTVVEFEVTETGVLLRKGTRASGRSTASAAFSGAAAAPTI
jgi:AbrB family looped-hinge helix DNA binding protein